MELVISVDESYYTADELAEFTEPRITRCRDCKWLGRESIVPGVQTGSSALYEWGIYDGVPFSRYACNTCIPLLCDFWFYNEYEVDNVREAFDSFLEVYEDEKTKTKVCVKCGKQLPLHSFERQRIDYWTCKDGFSNTCKECGRDER